MIGSGSGGQSLLQRVLEGLLVTAAIAVLARVVWEVLSPLLPVLVGLAVVAAIASWAVRRNRW